MTAAGLAARLRAAHHATAPLVVANAWDAASALALVDAGFTTIATSSGAVARSLGYADGEGTPVDAMFAAIGRIVAAVRSRGTAAAVTADIEHGYGLTADELAERLANAGAVGCNLEDSDPRTGRLVEPDAQAERLAALRNAAAAAGTGLVINARVDVHVRADGPEATRLARSTERARRYLAAGADCVFPITLASEPDIRAYVEAVGGPVNVLANARTPTLSRLAELGVARVSFGSGIHRLALAAVTSAAARILAGEEPW